MSVGGQTGEVGDPNGVRPGRSRALRQEVGSDGRVMAAVDGLGTVAAVRPGAQFLGPHEPAHPPLAAGVATGLEFLGQAHAAIGAALLHKHGLDQSSQSGLLLLAWAGAAVLPVVEATARDAQQLAEHPDRRLPRQLLHVHVAFAH